MSEPYIRARNLAKRYRSGEAALVVFEGLDLDVERGEMLALVGESGAGKSTLLHLLGGLDSPSEGTIHYGEREISGLAEADRADFRNREIGFVWQIHYLLPEFTALENVMMPLLIRGVAHLAAAAESGRPKTGAATKRWPALECAAASLSDKPALMVLMQMWIAPLPRLPMMPSPPNAAASTAPSSASIVITASPRQASFTRSAAFAPFSTSGCVFAAVRL